MTAKPTTAQQARYIHTARNLAALNATLQAEITAETREIADRARTEQLNIIGELLEHSSLANLTDEQLADLESYTA
jgi:hypothetical protein